MKIEIEKTAVESLLYGSEHLTSLGFDLVALAKKICPEHYEEFTKLFHKHHNANCGPLHKYVNDLLKE